MSSATVGMTRPQVANPPSGGVFGPPMDPPVVAGKPKRPKAPVSPKNVKPAGQKPKDPMAVMGGKKEKF